MKLLCESVLLVINVEATVAVFNNIEYLFLDEKLLCESILLLINARHGGVRVAVDLAVMNLEQIETIIKRQDF